MVEGRRKRERWESFERRKRAPRGRQELRRLLDSGQVLPVVESKARSPAQRVDHRCNRFGVTPCCNLTSMFSIQRRDTVRKNPQQERAKPAKRDVQGFGAAPPNRASLASLQEMLIDTGKPRC